jgi:hypothetical protein
MTGQEDLRSLSVAQLVERFTALAIEYDAAESIPETDRVYWLRDAIERELKSRDGEAWRALLPLYFHADIVIRHQAAEATRDQVPELARDRMLAIDDEEWVPLSEYASLFEPRLLAGRMRKPSKLKSMSVDQLVERFTMLSLAQDQALLMDELAKFSRLFDQIEAVADELKSRKGDQRRALLSLYRHPNIQVRLKAAKTTLAVAPEAARQELRAIANSREYPQAGDAGMCLRNLDEGIFKPT